MMSFARMPRTIFRTLPVLAILLAVVSPSVASAATSTWTGGGNNSWSPQANWGTSTLPTTTGTYSLQFGGATRTNTSNNIGTISVNSLSFTNTGGTGQNSFFQISSGTLAFHNSSIVTTTATAGVFTNNSNGDTISSAMTLSGTSTFTTADLHNLSLLGTMSGSGAVIFAQATPGATDYVYLGGTNTYSGGTTISTGVLAVGSSTALGTGFLSITPSGTGDLDLSGQALQVGDLSGNSTAVITFGGGTLQYSASNTQDYSSRITTSGSAIAIDTNGQTVPFAAAIDSSNTGGLMKQGAGTLFLNGVNTYTGNTGIVSGTLGGNGTIAGLVSVGTNAFISPGSAAGTTGVLSVRGLDLNLGGTALMSISGTGAGLYDQIAALGSVELNGALNIQFTQNDFQSADFWQLFSSGSGASGFSGHLGSVTATGAYGELSFSYLGSGEWKATGGLLAVDESLFFYENNSHALGETFLAGQLVLVPEPSTFVIAGLGMVVAGWQSLSHRPRLALLRQHTIPAAL